MYYLLSKFFSNKANQTKNNAVPIIIILVRKHKKENPTAYLLFSDFNTLYISQEMKKELKTTTSNVIKKEISMSVILSVKQM